MFLFELVRLYLVCCEYCEYCEYCGALVLIALNSVTTHATVPAALLHESLRVNETQTTARANISAITMDLIG